MQRLSNKELEDFLGFETELGGSSWTLKDGKLFISLKFPDFISAFAFMTAVAIVAEKSDHHPEWSNVYNRVDISLVTHDAGGITNKDLELAKEIARAYRHANDG
jgi:4a-hydroxytetrahydrobiopterin dehydratase